MKMATPKHSPSPTFQTRLLKSVFSGCCYGALTITQAPATFNRAPQQGRTASDSLALAFLRRNPRLRRLYGCPLFPELEPFTYLGEPCHRYFWEAVSSGAPPAKALYSAKVRYAKGFPTGRRQTELTIFD